MTYNFVVDKFFLRNLSEDQIFVFLDIEFKNSNYGIVQMSSDADMVYTKL